MEILINTFQPIRIKNAKSLCYGCLYACVGCCILFPIRLSVLAAFCIVTSCMSPKYVFFFSDVWFFILKEVLFNDESDRAGKSRKGTSGRRMKSSRQQNKRTWRADWTRHHETKRKVNDGECTVEKASENISAMDMHT